MQKFSQFNIDTKATAFVGKRMEMNDIFNTEIEIHKFKIGPSKYPKDKGRDKRLDMQISIDGEFKLVWTTSVALIEQILKVPEQGFPFTTKITKEDRRYQFN